MHYRNLPGKIGGPERGARGDGKQMLVIMCAKQWERLKVIAKVVVLWATTRERLKAGPPTI